jgi:AcrR family transcriptional regulator
MAGKRDKREAILKAMLDLVVERGFDNAPMSVLAKRSGASPGVIYHRS